jgi:hypothetical protein
MHLTWELIFDFVKQRWGLNKTKIAKILTCDPSKFSRKKMRLPLTDVEMIYSHLFKLPKTAEDRELTSVAYEKKEKESYLLADLRDFLEKAGCPEAKFIEDEQKQGAGYEDIMFELLRQANLRPPKDKSPAKKTKKEGVVPTPQQTVRLEQKTEEGFSLENEEAESTSPNIKVMRINIPKLPKPPKPGDVDDFWRFHKEWHLRLSRPIELREEEQ